MLKPKQSLGQNFLRDPNTIRRIVAALQAPEGAPVVEIGPGTGALTEVLLEVHPSLTAIEVDGRAVELLQEQFPSLDVRHQDVLEVDWMALAAERGGPLHVIGNLPYYITSPILFSLLDAQARLASESERADVREAVVPENVVREAVVMMQLEVAERLVAVPRTKAYGILSVLFQLYATPELLFRLSPHVFFPKPSVTSAVVRLAFHAASSLPAGDEAERLRAVVRAAFNQRRKTLRNSLHRWTREGGLHLPEGWERRRAEELTPAEFVELTRHLGRQA
ncbi:MAG: 16S rRNA (adenine(1518)-N(6)/adenine(1519)-N(6))-dimethyltransferase RsmA [Rhodothermales bacterium]